MARLKKARKPSEEGMAKTLYLRRGVVRRAEREARKEDSSLSALVDRILTAELDRRDGVAA